MRVRIAWPVGVLAALVVGYVVAVAVAPQRRAGVYGDESPAQSAIDGPAPAQLMRSSDTETDLSQAGGGAPPPILRGARTGGEPARVTDAPLDWWAGRDGARGTFRRWDGPPAEFFEFYSAAASADATYRRWSRPSERPGSRAPR